MEGRRKVLQMYLRNVINLLLDKEPTLATAVNKEKLVTALPFFRCVTVNLQCSVIYGYILHILAVPVIRWALVQ